MFWGYVPNKFQICSKYVPNMIFEQPFGLDKFLLILLKGFLYG